MSIKGIINSGTTIKGSISEGNQPQVTRTTIAGPQGPSGVGNFNVDISSAVQNSILQFNSTNNTFETVTLAGGTGVTITSGSVAIGQSVETTDNVTFNSVTGNLFGNATTSASLQTARTINGVSFDGSQNISFDTDSVSEGSNLYFTNERVDDRLNNLAVAGEGLDITYDDSSNTLTFAGEEATTSNKGIASFSSSDFDVSSGAVTIKSSSITNAQLAGSISTDKLSGSIANDKLANDSVSYGGVELELGQTDATPAFDLSDATGYPTSSLVGTITNAQLSGSIENGKLLNESVSYGGIELQLGQTDATPAFDLSDATGYPTSSLVGTITTSQLDGSITNAKLQFSTINFGGVNLALGQTDGTPAFNLADATGYPTSSLDGTITNNQLDGNITNEKIKFPRITVNGVTGNLGETITLNTSHISESGNLYYTDARVFSAIAGLTSGLGLSEGVLFVDLNELTTETSIAQSDFIAMVDETDSGSGKITFSDLEDTVFGNLSGDLSVAAGGAVTLSPSASPEFTNLTLSGNLTVNGDTVTLNVTNKSIEDNLILVNHGVDGSTNANDAGILIERGSTGDNAFIGWDESEDKFILGTTSAGATSTGNLSITTGTLTANLVGNVTGALTGNADTATTSTNVVITDNESTAEDNALVFVAGADIDGSTSVGLESDGTLTYNPSTGKITATGFVGALTGNASTASALASAVNIGGVSFDGSGSINLPGVNTSGNQDTSGTAALATTVTVSDNTANTDFPVVFHDESNALLDDTGTFIYNPSTGLVTATGFSGNLTGTLQTAAQTNVTSLGTLTALQVDNLNINGNTLSSTAGTDLLITPLTGQQIVLDGTIVIDAGVVTGATSITSTAFVGDITGDVTGNADTATVATTVTITDNESTDESNALIFTAGGDVDGGNLGLESDGTLTYNPSTGKITATGFVGTLTGNVTGNTSGTAATVTGAAQTNITSLGTLTALTVDNIAINGTTIGHTSDTDILSFANSEPRLTVNASAMEIVDTGTGDNAGPTISLFRNSSSPANSDQLGRILFLGQNDAGEKTYYAQMTSSISGSGVDDGGEACDIQFFVTDGGSGVDNTASDLTEDIFDIGPSDTPALTLNSAGATIGGSVGLQLGSAGQGIKFEGSNFASGTDGGSSSTFESFLRMENPTVSFTNSDSHAFLYLPRGSGVLLRSRGTDSVDDTGSLSNGSVINKTNDTITFQNAHELRTGDPVIYNDAFSTEIEVSNVDADGGRFFAIVEDSTTIKIANTEALALAGTSLDIDDDGGDFQSFLFPNQVDEGIRMHKVVFEVGHFSQAGRDALVAPTKFNGALLYNDTTDKLNAYVDDQFADVVTTDDGTITSDISSASFRFQIEEGTDSGNRGAILNESLIDSVLLEDGLDTTSRFKLVLEDGGTEPIALEDSLREDGIDRPQGFLTLDVETSEDFSFAIVEKNSKIGIESATPSLDLTGSDGVDETIDTNFNGTGGPGGAFLLEVGNGGGYLSYEDASNHQDVKSVDDLAMKGVIAKLSGSLVGNIIQTTNSDTTVDSSVVLGYVGRTYVHKGSANVTINLPNASSGLSIGDQIHFVNCSTTSASKIILSVSDFTQTLSICTGASVVDTGTDNPHIVAGGVATLISIGVNEYTLFGSGVVDN